MIIATEELRSLLTAAFEVFKPRQGAEFTANAILEAAFRKDDRVNPVAEAVSDLEKYHERGRPTLTVVSESPAVVVADLNGAPGACYMAEILEEVRTRATACGVGAYGFRNTGGVHGMSTWVQPLADAGFLATFAWNGGSYTTVPFGSTEPFFGTNPIGYAIPTADGQQIVADFATSQIPFMNLRKAYQDRDPLPPEAGLDPEGNPTTDSQVVYGVPGDGLARLRPMGGGPKGSALMLLVEVLTGALVGGKMGRAATDDPFIPEEFGGVVLAFDLGAFGAAETFRPEVQRLADDIRASKPAPMIEHVDLPGDGELRRRSARLARGGLDLDDALIARLRALA